MKLSDIKKIFVLGCMAAGIAACFSETGDKCDRVSAKSLKVTKLAVDDNKYFSDVKDRTVLSVQKNALSGSFLIKSEGSEQGDILKKAGTASLKTGAASGDFKGAKKAVIKAYKRCAASVNVRKYNLNYASEYAKLKKMMTQVLARTPSLFYVTDNYTVSRDPVTDRIIRIGLHYDSSYMTKNGKPDAVKIKKDKKRINNIMNTALEETSPSMDDIGKALVLHDYIVNRTAYTEDSKYSFRKRSSGVLLKGRANCTGYSLAYVWLLKKAGIRAIVVDSDKMEHSWNKVYINRKWYNVDTTWDDPEDSITNRDQYGVVKHQFFLCSDAKFRNNDHYDFESSKYVTGTEYDDAFWSDIDSGIYYDNGKWLYCTTGGIVSRSGLMNGTSKVVYNAYADKLVRHSDDIYYYIDKKYNAIYMYTRSSNSTKCLWKAGTYYKAPYELTQIKATSRYLYYRAFEYNSCKQGKLALNADGTLS